MTRRGFTTVSVERDAAISDRTRLDLQGDCGNCFGLCCVALPFAASSDFAADKAAGKPCTNLQQDFRCGIHTRLRERGYSGCTVYDCFGAGQKVSQVTFGGRDWRSAPDTARQMFDVFPVVRQLHELLWYLAEALALPAAGPLHAELRRVLDETERLAGQSPDALQDVDVAAHRQVVNVLLLRTSELVRAEVKDRSSEKPARPAKGGRGKRGPKIRPGADLTRADLFGASLKGAGLQGATLRGACLIAADLTGADLRTTDLIGVDCRDADLAGADLTGSFFLTQPQLNAAKGDAATKLPPSLTRPSHWAA